MTHARTEAGARAATPARASRVDLDEATEAAIDAAIQAAVATAPPLTQSSAPDSPGCSPTSVHNGQPEAEALTGQDKRARKARATATPQAPGQRCQNSDFGLPKSPAPYRPVVTPTVPPSPSINATTQRLGQLGSLHHPCAQRWHPPRPGHRRRHGPPAGAPAATPRSASTKPALGMTEPLTRSYWAPT